MHYSKRWMHIVTVLVVMVGLMATYIPLPVPMVSDTSTVPEAEAAWTEPAIAPIMMTAPLAPPPVTGTTFYVDANSVGGACNNANAGTSVSAPWCTLAKAMQTLTAGQRAYFRAATYVAQDLRPTNSGTAGNYITFQAYPGESPVFNCAGGTWCFDGVSAGAKSFIVINGFEMHHPNQQFFVCNSSVNCNHWWFVNGKYHDSGTDFAGFVFDSSFNVFSNNEIYNSDAPVLMGGGGGAQHNNIGEFNIFRDNGRRVDDEGAFKCGGGGYNCVIRYNTVYNNWRDPSATWCFNNNPCKGVAGIYIDTGDDALNGGRSYVYNNVVYDNDMGIEIFESSNVTIFNNLVYHNGFTPNGGTKPSISWGVGMKINTDTKLGLEVYNNTVYGNSSHGIQFQNTRSNGLISRNNIVMNNNSQMVDGGAEINSSPNDGAANMNFNYDLMSDSSGGALIRYNSTNYSSLASFQARAGNTTWTHAVASPAQFVNTASGDFHEAAGSPSINAGTAVSLFNYDKDNVTRPQGSAWDIGAYEFGGTSPTPTPLTQALINAGGPQYTASDGVYAADAYFSGGSTFSNTKAIASTVDDTLYNTERYGNPFSYNIPIQNGTYTVTLKFVETYLTGPGQRSFSVSAEGTTALSNIDIYAAAGADTAYDRTFPVTVSDGTLNLVFSASVENAKVNAIKVVPASSPTPTPTPTPGPIACSQYTPSSTIPTGYASPFDVVTSPSTNLMNVTCDVSSAKINLGKGDPLQYIYNQGYLFKTGGTAWSPVPYTSTEQLIANAWYPKSATTNISLTSTELANPSYALAYICSWIGSGWKCGCRDSACTQSYWQIQSFKR
jgi:parallel beta-helix repeat protein